MSILHLLNRLLLNTMNNNIKIHFPVFIHEPTLAYLDSAATTLTPQSVIDVMNVYYQECPVNVRRGMYSLGEKANIMAVEARKKVADFVHAIPEEIIFTSGTTQSINMLARMLESRMTEQSNIVLTRIEHHANLIPWQQLAKRTNAEIRFIELTDDNDIDRESIKKVIDEHTAVVSMTLVSNVLGSIIPAQEIIAAAKTVHAITVIDAAQAVGHMQVNVQELDCDFMAFSAHKMYGPKGIGVLYGKKALLDELDPSVYGGDMIREVNYTDATWGDVPYKFEAGTQNIPGIIGFGAAASFITSVGWEQIEFHEHDLTVYALDRLQRIDGVHIVGPSAIEKRSGVISFTVDGIHPHDVNEALNAKNVAVRAGHHCAMPLTRRLGLPGTIRMSFGVYSSKEDIDCAVDAIKGVIRVFAK